MKKLIPLFCLALAAFVFSCEEQTNTEATNIEETENQANAEMNGESAEEQAAEENAELPDVDAVGNFGAQVEAEGAIDGPALLARLEAEDSVRVKVRSKITGVCQAKGCWMTMPLMDEKEMMVKFKDYAFFVPRNATGKQAVVDGWAYREVVSVDELRHYAEDAGASEEEIEAINEEEERISFMADGVNIMAMGGDVEMDEGKLEDVNEEANENDD